METTTTTTPPPPPPLPHQSLLPPFLSPLPNQTTNPQQLRHFHNNQQAVTNLPNLVNPNYPYPERSAGSLHVTRLVQEQFHQMYFDVTVNTLGQIELTILTLSSANQKFPLLVKLFA